MGGSLKPGSVVVAAFPFSDLTRSKRRPALVIANAEFGDYIICQITSSSGSSKTAISLKRSDFATGSLSRDSYIRADKIFTADPSTISYKAGDIKVSKNKAVKKELFRLFELT